MKVTLYLTKSMDGLGISIWACPNGDIRRRMLLFQIGPRGLDREANLNFTNNPIFKAFDFTEESLRRVGIPVNKININ